VVKRFFGTPEYLHLYRGRIDDGDALAVEINRSASSTTPAVEHHGMRTRGQEDRCRT
jgi:hypothetical protein